MTETALYILLGRTNYARLQTTFQYLTHSVLKTALYVLLDRSNNVRNLLHRNQHEILLRILFIATLYDPCELRYLFGAVTVLTVTLWGY